MYHVHISVGVKSIISNNEQNYLKVAAFNLYEATSTISLFIYIIMTSEIIYNINSLQKVT